MGETVVRTLVKVEREWLKQYLKKISGENFPNMIQSTKLLI